MTLLIWAISFVVNIPYLLSFELVEGFFVVSKVKIIFEFKILNIFRTMSDHFAANCATNSIGPANHNADFTG